MKPRIHKVLRLTALTALAAFAFSSCIRDNVDKLSPNSGEFKPGMAATLTFDPSFEEHETRADYETYGPAGETFPEGNALDSKMTTFRVLIYDHATGNLMKTGSQGWNYLIDAKTAATPYKINVATGTYDFVFIANEKSLGAASLFGADRSAGAAIDTFAELAALDFSYPAGSNPADITGGADPDGNGLAGSGTAGDDITIPMVRIYENVQVRGANAVSLDGGATTIASPWACQMVRTAIRISAHLNIAPEEYKAWKTYSGTDFPKIFFDGLRDRTHFVPGTPNLGGTSQTAEPLGSVGIPVVTEEQMTDASIEDQVARGEYGVLQLYKNGAVDNSTSTPDKVEVFIERLIFPELVFSPASAEANSLRMSMRFDDGAGGIDEKAVLLHAVNTSLATGYTLPRNSWLWLDGNVDNELSVTTRVLPWNDGDLEEIDERNYHFTIDREILVFPNTGGTEQVNIFTDHPAGWELDTATLPSWISSFTPGTGATNSESTVTITASTGGATLLEEDIIVKSGNLIKKITVIVLGSNINVDTPPSNVLMYVGAFWKAQQYGERLIRITRPTTAPVTAIDGDWVATVIEGEDWIVLDKEVSKDHNVGWRTDVTPNEASVANGNDVDFDAIHRVNSTETTVVGKMSAGNPEIYFRVGLDAPYTPTETEPARYGVVLLIYKNNGTTKYHKIYVRQGEEPDYLMRPIDAAPSAGLTTREKAVKFSPYNLKDPDDGSPTAVITTGVPDAGIPLRGGVPTDYPSQSGHFFLWNYSRQAFSPSTPTGAIAGWESSLNGSGSWNENITETCPDGYRRVQDGDNTEDNTLTTPATYSEVRQSLFLNPPQGSDDSKTQNSCWGYYADGFFDRRALEASLGDSPLPDKAVSTGDNRIAYIGRLFYNPATFASLFFPGSGARQTDDGRVHYAGAIAFSWTSNYTNGSHAVPLYLTNNRVFVNVGTTTDPSSSRRFAFPVRCVVIPIP